MAFLSKEGPALAALVRLVWWTVAAVARGAGGAGALRAQRCARDARGEGCRGGGLALRAHLPLPCGVKVLVMPRKAVQPMEK
jgi:hypothetical protein